jgi:hypothetical protein
MSVRFRLSALIIVGALAAGARPARVHGAGQATSIVPSPQGPQARDAQTKLAVGSASISGVVVDAGDPTVPIRRAIVTAAGAALGEARSTVTDDNGAFALDHLPAGSFTVTASKAAYLAASFGAKRPVHAGTPMAVAAGQRLTGLSLQMSKGGVISGVIHDGDGNAVPGVQVLAMRTGEPPPLLGLPGLGQQVGSLTDDRGAYRLYGLSPGAYSVVAVITSSLQAEMHRRAAAEIDAAFRAAQEKGGAPATPPTMPPPTIYAAAPVYYPGTAYASQAATVDVHVGGIHDDVSFIVEPVPSVAIDGVVERMTGSTGNLTLVISGAGSATPLSLSMAPRLFTPPGPDGRFRYINVTPGRYTISAYTTDASLAGGRGGGASPVATGPSTTSWATAEVDVNGADISGLALTMQPGMTVSGRVAIDAMTRPVPADLTAIRVSMIPLDSTGSASSNGTSYGAPQRSSSAKLEADGSFTVEGLAPGTYRVNAAAPGIIAADKFWLRSATADDRDALDTRLTITAGHSVDRLVLTLTDRHSELSGSLATPEGHPATDYFVVVLPTDRAMWLADARRIKSTRLATDGQYSFADLPAGSYILAAVDDLETTDLADASFLEAVAKTGVPVTIADGEKTKQDLRLR